MPNPSWKDITETVGIVAIVASLIFVGLEMRQTRSIALAATYQARTDSEMFFQSIAMQPHIQEAFAKDRGDEILTPKDKQITVSVRNLGFMYLENVHYQFELEMLTEEIWNAHLLGHLSGDIDDPDFRDWWAESRKIWRPSFASSIDQFIENYDSGQ